MDVLRIATAGSVDDGKSTLIGRLLHDTHSIPADKLEAITVTSKRKGLGFTDLSLLTDGLIAEREQGITIDVAHIYFSTPSRKYIIADTPGHIEYTRNMITGASKAQVSVILIDARNGIIEQTRRHLFISALLKIENAFICINKMDLAGFEESVFNSIKDDCVKLAQKIKYSGHLHFVPVVARDGDNIVTRSKRIGWYQGPSLLQMLEQVPLHSPEKKFCARMPVQYVIRPHDDVHHDFRGYAGRIVTGTIGKGETVTVQPSLKQTVVKNILRGQQSLDKAVAGESVVLELEDDVDISRGNMIIGGHCTSKEVHTFSATLAWLDAQPLTTPRSFLLQHHVNRVKAKITAITGVLDIHSMEENPQATRLELNDIGKVEVKLARPLFADTYDENPSNGAFVLIDEFTNNTVAAGFIQHL